MKSSQLLLSSAVIIATLTSARADDDCESRWLKAEEAKIVLGVAMINGTPTFGVDRAVWDQIDYNTRAGMMETFICVIAGPGKTLTRARIIDGQGIPLAEWSHPNFEILR